MKKIANTPKVFVNIQPHRIHLSLANHFCFEGDPSYLPWLQSYAAKKPLPIPPFSLDHLSLYTQKILNKLLLIPFGSTLTYSNLDQAARAAGSACGRNPYPLFIPCHRIIAKNSIGGFALDLNIKRALLNFEVD